jgi:hypothetical protein
MSAQLRPEAVPPSRAMPRSLSSLSLATGPAGGGEAAFEAWLRRELGRLYGATLAEPVPDALARLLKPHPAEADAGTPSATPA